jgi:hypothetical protein
MTSSEEIGRSLLKTWKDKASKLRGILATAEGGLNFMAARVKDLEAGAIRIEGINSDWELLLTLDGVKFKPEDPRDANFPVRETTVAKYSEGLSLIFASGGKLFLAAFRPLN